jgi:hypothetical protein
VGQPGEEFPTGVTFSDRLGDLAEAHERRVAQVPGVPDEQEHRDLDSAIEALLAVPGYDRLQVQRLKKRKLQLRDRITQIEDELFPDIIA